MKFGSLDITDCKLGSTPIVEVRRGTELIWPEVDNAFLATWDTRNTLTGSSADNQLALPILSDANVPYDFIIEWGDGTSDHIWQAPYNERVHTYPAPGIYQTKITGVFSYLYFGTANSCDLERNKLIGFDAYGGENVTWRSGRNNDFKGITNPITFPEGGGGNFWNTITSGNNMFYLATGITSLPSDATFDSLTNGFFMFRQSGLTALPANAAFQSLTSASSMFYGTPITSLPSGMLLDNLTVGSEMFYNSQLSSLPSGMTLQSLDNGNRMFQNAPITAAPDLNLASLTNGSNMFSGVTLNTPDYSNILIRMEANNPNSNIVFHGGASKYNADGKIARDALIARGWTITDGGQI